MKIPKNATALEIMQLGQLDSDLDLWPVTVTEHKPEDFGLLKLGLVHKGLFISNPVSTGLTADELIERLATVGKLTRGKKPNQSSQ